MMNRNVMQRQMFANGGAAFPDLSGDGNVTQKDILMGRGVLPMQEGGSPMMMPPPPGGAMMPPPGGPMGGPPPMPPGAAMAPPGAADQDAFDPAVLEGMLADSAQSMQSMDAAAEAGDYASVINSIRGDEMPIEARYEELAGMVGPEDSQQTPESVLTLLQPVMQMAAVDQGIGGLAQEEMTTPIEGPMAEGIMSTVNMEGPPAGPDQMAMAAPGGAAPVNFRQGGAVQYFNPENANRVVQPDPLGGRLGEIFEQKQALRQNLFGQEDQQAAFDEQQKMTKAQMLFDIAQGALAFATPGETAMSPAERLAQVAQPVLGNISARAGELQKFKQGQEQEQRAIDLQTLGSAESSYESELARSASSAAAEAERNWKTSENALERVFQFQKMDKQFKFTKGENETDRSFQERMTDRKLAMQQTLLELQASTDERAINLRGQLASELAQLNNTFKQTLQQSQFDFTNKERLGTQEYQSTVLGQRFANDKSILALQNDNSNTAIELRAKLQKENDTLKNEWLVAAKSLAYDNVLKRDNILNTNDLAKMEVGQEYNVALTDLRGSLEEQARLSTQAFQAAQAVLNRQADSTKQMSDQEFRKEMAEELRKFTKDEAAIDRQINATQQAIENSFTASADSRAEKVLTIQERAQILDEDYKMGNLYLEQEAAKIQALGSKSKTAELTYIADPARMEAFANGTLGEETALYEQKLLDYTGSEPVWDPEIGAFVKGSSKKLTDTILDFVKRGNPDLYTKISGVSLDASGEPVKPNRNLMTASSEIMNLDGTVNRQSEAWSLTAPNRFKPDVDYRKVIGASRVFPSIVKVTSEGFAELVGADSTDASKNLASAAKSLTNLANDILQYNTGDQQGRILKFVQELIEQETKDIRPGGLFIKTDAAAEASFDAIADTLAQQLQLGASFLPEYGGNSAGYGQKVIETARKDMQKLKILFNEVQAFQKGFKFKTSKSRKVGEDDQSDEQLANQIRQMMKGL